MFLLGSNVDFLIHLGDFKPGNSKCDQSRIDQLDDVLKMSPVPVFIVVGDNEYNDCRNISPRKALTHWRNAFERYDVRYWNHDFKVTQLHNRPEIFAFVNKRTLFLGLNLVGGRVHDKQEWADRHADQLSWVKDLMWENKKEIHSVVLFGHANPGRIHSDFFNPFAVFTDIPVLYMCGDAHKWAYNLKYLGVDNWLRVRLTGHMGEPIVKITVDPEGRGNDPVDAFKVERFLDV